MSNKVKVSSVTIELKDGCKIELGLDEARALYKDLESLFGDKTFVSPAPIVIDRDRWLTPYAPIWTCADKDTGKYEATWSSGCGSSITLNCDSTN